MLQTTKAPLRVSSKPALRVPYQPKHPFAEVFLDMAGHSPAAALEQLLQAVRDNRQNEMAYDWAQTCLPGAAMKPAIAIGTVGELYRKYARNQEYVRFTGVLTPKH
ncbi:hypothetical protein [Paraburkholderia sp. A3RO-2L]|uniref:hypothetical protein n=1 Tax=Paraburkholderia sp. A3RO-2L TaxID=3028376 RepID=UPI0032F12440|nr:hypothetical protein [Burkholderia vietnamiensis]